MIVRSAVKRAYVDSVTLMLAQREVRAQAGIEEAGMVLATEANRALLREAGLLTPDAEAAGPDDLVISVRAASPAAAEAALAFAQRLLTQRRETATAGGTYRPRTIAAARRMLPRANLAAISVPGRYAGGVAREALAAGLHVFLFSDNVPVETEVALKQEAAARGLLLMGPDCGTALLGGVGLGFANKVRRGRVGIVAAAGTGLQEVSSLIHRFGGGVSHAIGTGGRDLSEAVGGAAMLRGLAALGADAETSVIVLIGKPPHPHVARRVIGAARIVGKPVILTFVGARVGSRGEVMGAETLEDAAAAAVRQSGEGDTEETTAQSLPAQEAGRLLPTQQYLRGLFSGGTLCAEAQALLRPTLGRIASNAPLEPRDRVPGAAPSQGHAILDLGGDEFTQGRLHPMIDPSLRLARFAQEAADPEVGVILLDVVLGYGVDPDPGGRLAPAVAAARRRALEAGRYLCVVGSLCGTDGDPQDFSAQSEALIEAGMIVERSNARAARLAGRILMGRGGRGEEQPGPADGTVPVQDIEGGGSALPDPGETGRLLSAPGHVINVGLELFSESLRAQGVRVIDLDWRPPAGGKRRMQDLLERLET